MKPYVATPCREGTDEGSLHCFYAELQKIIPNYNQIPCLSRALGPLALGEDLRRYEINNKLSNPNQLTQELCDLHLCFLPENVYQYSFQAVLQSAIKISLREETVNCISCLISGLCAQN